MESMNSKDLTFEEIQEDFSRKLSNLTADMGDVCHLSPERHTQSNENELILEEAVDEAVCLTDLPTEILIHIASFLESRDIGTSLYRTCKLFYDLFSDEMYWKTRVTQRWPKPYPIDESKT